MNRHSTAADRWRGLLQRQGSSGLSIAAFCRREGVSQPSFYAWRRRLRDEVTFAEVKLSREMTAEAGGIELRLPRGRCVVIRPGFDRQTLIALLAILAVWNGDAARFQMRSTGGRHCVKRLW